MESTKLFTFLQNIAALQPLDVILSNNDITGVTPTSNGVLSNINSNATIVPTPSINPDVSENNNVTKFLVVVLVVGGSILLYKVIQRFKVRNESEDKEKE